MYRRLGRAFWAATIFLYASAPANAEGVQHVNGAELQIFWAIPFVALLLSIAVVPLVAPHLWHRRYGLITAGWSLAFLLPFALVYGTQHAVYEFLEVTLIDYLSFIILIASTYVISGGIYLEGRIKGTPAANTMLLAAGTALGSFTGTIGASVLLVRPLLRANAGRKHTAHIFIFFIFLVSNMGGSLTPLGPPLYMGILKGIDFFWPLLHVWKMFLVVSLLLLVAFFFVDSVLGGKKPDAPPEDSATAGGLRIRGWRNVPLLLIVPAAIIGSALWKDLRYVDIEGVHLTFPDIARNAVLAAAAIISLLITPRAYREGNHFTAGPVVEVAKLFAGIFVTMVPVLAMLKAGQAGAFRDLLALVTNPDGSPNNAMYFWLTGGLSSFLDNAPTYLVFLNAAGGDAETLMGPLAMTLAAISAGAAFMGANTYIGNAPNFMVKAIAEEAGVKMPSFFGFMIWALVFTVPAFALVTWLFFL